MALTAAILNSLGALAILIGALVQGLQAYGQFKRHGDVLMWRDRNGYIVPMAPGVWANVVKPTVTREAVEEIRKAKARVLRVPVCDGHIEGEVPFLPSPRTFRKHQVTFAGVFGWELIFVGGALVLVGSILAAVDAA